MTVASQSCKSRLVSTFATNSTSSKTRSIAVTSSTFCQTGQLEHQTYIILAKWSLPSILVTLSYVTSAEIEQGRKTKQTNLYVPDSRRLSPVLDYQTFLTNDQLCTPVLTLASKDVATPGSSLCFLTTGGGGGVRYEPIREV